MAVSLAKQRNTGTSIKKVMSITRSQATINKILGQRKKIRFDLAIQRNNVWKEAQQQKLIDSILRNFLIPAVVVIESDDGFMWMADGKQRYGSIFKFHDNGFALPKGMAPVEIEVDGEVVTFDVEGKLYKDLDKAVQNQIKNYEMDIRNVRNASPAQIEELFVRLNNGTPLSKIELVRATIGSENQEKINLLSAYRFFDHMAFISDGSRNRFVDQEMIIQTLMLVMGRETGISSKEINDFKDAVRASGISEETMRVMTGTADYLKDAFEQFIVMKEGKEDLSILNKMLKKIHVPMLFMTAIESIQEEVQPEVFGQWAKSFLHDRYTSGHGEYGKRCVAGSAKKENVQGRLKAMKADFTAKIEAMAADWESNAPIREKLRIEAEQEEARLEAERIAAEADAARLAEEEAAKGGQSDTPSEGGEPQDQPAETSNETKEVIEGTETGGEAKDSGEPEPQA